MTNNKMGVVVDRR